MLVPVVPVAHVICDPEMKLRPVDRYVENIWGRRVWRAVLERAAVQAQCGGVPELSVEEDERCDMAVDRGDDRGDNEGRSC